MGMEGTPSNSPQLSLPVVSAYLRKNIKISPTLLGVYVRYRLKTDKNNLSEEEQNQRYKEVFDLQELQGLSTSISTASPQQVFFLASSSDNKQLVVEYEHERRIWDLASKKTTASPLYFVDRAPDVKGLSSVNGKYEAVRITNNIEHTDCDRTILLNYLDENKQRALRGHTDTISSLAFSKDKEALQLVSGSYDGTIKIWQTADGTCIFTINTGDQVYCIDINLAGTIIASANNKDIISLWEPTTGNLLGRLNSTLTIPRNLTWAKTEKITALAFENNTTLFSGSKDSAIKQWDITPFANTQEYIQEQVNTTGKIRAYLRPLLEQIEEALKNNQTLNLTPIEKTIYETLPEPLKKIFENIIA